MLAWLLGWGISELEFVSGQEGRGLLPLCDGFESLVGGSLVTCSLVGLLGWPGR